MEKYGNIQTARKLRKFHINFTNIYQYSQSENSVNAVGAVKRQPSQSTLTVCYKSSFFDIDGGGGALYILPNFSRFRQTLVVHSTSLIISNISLVLLSLPPTPNLHKPTSHTPKTHLENSKILTPNSIGTTYRTTIQTHNQNSKMTPSKRQPFHTNTCNTTLHKHNLKLTLTRKFSKIPHFQSKSVKNTHLLLI